MSKKITPDQLKCLNTLVSKLGVDKTNKEIMILGFSNGRASSSKDLTFAEATEVIRHLKTFDPNERMRKKVFALAYEAGIIWGDTPEDRKMNAAKLNVFLLKGGTVKKELNAMTEQELVKVVSQFQQIVKHTGESKANKATKTLLAELNIPTENNRKKTI